MPYMTQVTAGQRTALSVFCGVYPTLDGTGVRDYIHVMDLVEGNAAALNFMTETTSWHAINLGIGKGYSVLEMARTFENASDGQVPYKIVTRRAGDVAACYADPKNASDRLSWCATRTLEDTFANTWHFPSGWYDSIDEVWRFQVKRTQIKPGTSLSLQKHHHRAEKWVGVKGTAEVTCNDKKLLLTENQSTYIPLGDLHRLANPGTIPLELFEVQSGSNLGEDAIVRFDEHYGRSQA